MQKSAPDFFTGNEILRSKKAYSERNTLNFILNFNSCLCFHSFLNGYCCCNCSANHWVVAQISPNNLEKTLRVVFALFMPTSKFFWCRFFTWKFLCCHYLRRQLVDKMKTQKRIFYDTLCVYSGMLISNL